MPPILPANCKTPAHTPCEQFWHGTPLRRRDSKLSVEFVGEPNLSDHLAGGGIV
jgi:hypothetical protein